MKTKSIKKLLASALTVAMLMGSALTVTASGGDSDIQSDSGAGTQPQSSQEVSQSVPEEAVTAVSAGGSVSVAGSKVTNTVAGSYVVKSFQGAAVITPLDQVKANLGLSSGQTPHIIAFDTNAKKSHLAMDCVNAAAGALGGSMVSAINVTLDAKENGKLITLANGSAAMMLGLPKNADLSKTYYVVCVQPGGIVTILNNISTVPGTVAFEIKAGLGTYAVIAV